MDADVVQCCLEAGGRDLLLHPSSPPSLTSASAAASSSILQSLPLHVAIQELRARKDGHVVIVGIGGSTGSGKTSLAEKVASVLGCVVIVSMEDYRTGAGGDDGSSDIDAIDFDALARNLQGGSFNSDSSSPMREISSTDSVLDDMQSRIRKLERWNTINMVLWTILLSALVGYSLYQKRRH